MLLKLSQSEDCNCPVLTEEAKGRLRVKALVVVEMLKILPEVPVEIFWLRTTLPLTPMVEVPVMLMPVPEMR